MKRKQATKENCAEFKPLTPRPALFFALLAGFLAWLVLLWVLWFFTRT